MLSITTIEEEHLMQLVQAIQLLAADYEAQIKQLPDFVHIPDELALIYSESVLLAEQIARTSLITQDQVAKLRELDLALEDMSREKSLWTLEAVRNSAEWQRIKSMAKDLLALLNQQVHPPDLSWIKYVKGNSGKPDKSSQTE